ncbi:MAG TPA: DNA-formamidopyrimidine glycosylase family protein [Vicinamibacterales bacterium]|nr:DNA-formamidopyrimidine glycosylase family protein [Vicinamibacterales bacterium]
MPELPDVIVYVEALNARVVGEPLEAARIASPFVLRSVDPPLDAAVGRRVAGVRRLGKRVVLELEGELFLVVHLMIAGRLRWRERGAAIPGKVGLAAFDFPPGTVLLTEAGSRKQASLHVVSGRARLAEHDRGGLEVLDASVDEFRDALTRENHTVKRALTDPTLLSGIGNAYSDEILHAARLSPARLTQRLTGEEIARLFDSTRAVLTRWIDLLRSQAGGSFPEKVTAFHEEMAVHGRFGKPCPACGTPVQRIVYARNESNYCPRCQTENRLLSDRSLSRLLREDWPTTIEELERRRG